MGVSEQEQSKRCSDGLQEQEYESLRTETELDLFTPGLLIRGDPSPLHTHFISTEMPEEINSGHKTGLSVGLKAT